MLLGDAFGHFYGHSFLEGHTTHQVGKFEYITGRVGQLGAIYIVHRLTNLATEG